MSVERGPGLRRDLGLVDAVGVGLGAIIGAGLFVVTGLAAGVAGPAFLIGLLIAGIAAACNALSSAQLAAAFPQSGGTYEYGYRLLNPWLGFAAGWMFLASKLAAAGAVALGFEATLRAFWPALPPRIPAVLTVAILTAANLLGIKKAGRLNATIVVVTVAALVYFITGGIGRFDSANLEPFAAHGIRGILESAALLFFAYTGYARLATLGEEVHEPKRTIPRAIILALVIATVLYAGASLVTVGAIGADAMAATPSPLIRASESFRFPAAATVAMIGATTAMLGVLLSQLLGISRMMLAMSRRRDLPAGLAHIRESTGVPDYGILLTGFCVAIIAAIGSIPWAAASASFAILLYYAIANLAALRQPVEDRLFPRWIPVFGLILCLLLSVSLSFITIASGVVLLTVGLGLRWIARRLSRVNR